MSTTYIPVKVKLLLFGAAGGRCEYRGCNQLVTEDDLTGTDGNFSVFAHIVADSPDGPRGHVVRSSLLKADFSNLMVLCLKHHRLIDVDALEAHPEELLAAMKAEHEERIRKLTAIDGQHRTQVLMLQANIGQKKGLFDPRFAIEAVLPRYPANDPFQIELANLRIQDGEELYWKVGAREIEKAVETLVERLLADTHRHVSVFALAPIPLLMILGRCLGELIPADVYQCLREPDGDGVLFDKNPWRWSPDDPNAPLLRDLPPVECCATGDVALVLEVSGDGLEERAREQLGPDVPIYVLGIENPGLDRVRCERQLRDFRSRVREFLGNLRGRLTAQTVVHVFPALPNSFAVEFGRLLLQKVDLEMRVYDLNRFRQGPAVPIVLLGPLDKRVVS